MKWNKLSSEEVLNHKYFKVNKDIVELPTGEKIEWLYWNSKDSAMIVAQTPEGELVMIKQYRYLPDQVALEFPSGHSDEGEAIEDCVIRELEEETGYSCKSFELLGKFYETMGQLNRQIHIFFTNNAYKIDGKTKAGDITEDIEVVLMNTDEVIEMAFEGKIISMGSTLAALLMDKKRSKSA